MVLAWAAAQAGTMRGNACGMKCALYINARQAVTRRYPGLRIASFGMHSLYCFIMLLQFMSGKAIRLRFEVRQIQGANGFEGRSRSPGWPRQSLMPVQTPLAPQKAVIKKTTRQWSS